MRHRAAHKILDWRRPEGRQGLQELQGALERFSGLPVFPGAGVSCRALAKGSASLDPDDEDFEQSRQAATERRSELHRTPLICTCITGEACYSGANARCLGRGPQQRLRRTHRPQLGAPATPRTSRAGRISWPSERSSRRFRRSPANSRPVVDNRLRLPQGYIRCQQHHHQFHSHYLRHGRTSHRSRCRRVTPVDCSQSGSRDFTS